MTFDLPTYKYFSTKAPALLSSSSNNLLILYFWNDMQETMGVCVVTFSDTKDFPAFYTRKSGYQTIYNVSNAHEAADFLLSIKKLQLQSGILLGVPIPEEYSLNGWYSSSIPSHLFLSLCMYNSSSIFFI